ncbi:hypothetical protein J3F84DRAFT_353602 [Trichoderma pleuroticola]
MADAGSLPSPPVEDPSNTPPVPDALMQRYHEYLSRRPQQSDKMKLHEVLEELEREEDALYIIQLIHMYKGHDAYFKDDVEKSGEFAVNLSTLPDELITRIWNYLSRRGLLD